LPDRAEAAAFDPSLAAKGGAYSYLKNERMIGSFGAIGWPARYGEPGVVSLHCQPERRGLRGGSRARDGATRTGHHQFDPDKDWQMAEMTPP
jgi:hypothetical protein